MCSLNRFVLLNTDLSVVLAFNKFVNILQDFFLNIYWFCGRQEQSNCQEHYSFLALSSAGTPEN